MAGMLFQSAEHLVRDGVNLTVGHKTVFASALYAGHGAIVITHCFATVFGSAFVFSPAVTVANLTCPGLM